MSIASRDRVLSAGGMPVWLPLGPEPMYGVLHTPAGPEARGTAVLIVPPFGWEDVCSYRARRQWAISLATAGFITARIDLPGSGDSAGSPFDPGRAGSWIDAVTAAARWLRESCGGERVAAIGLGLGGLLAYRAASAGAAIDDLILWGAPARGRGHLRELQVYSGAVKARSRGPKPPDPEPGSAPGDGTRELTGFALSAETAAALEAIKLDELPLPGAPDRRVLLLERDQRGVDERLREHLEQLGVQLTIAPASDYAMLMAHPQQGLTPDASIARSIEWLTEGESPPRTGGAPAPASPANESVSFHHDGRVISESLIGFGRPGERSVGILSEPAGTPRLPICAVLINAGALRRTGPNRLWVELARGWAARGVPAVRVDLEGLGDSDGDGRPYAAPANLYRPEMIGRVVALLDQLQSAGVADRFVLAGLCSGAHFTLHAALQDERVTGGFLINLYAFFWSERLREERDRRLTVGLMRGGLIQRLRRHGLPRHELRRALAAFRPSLREVLRASEEKAQAKPIDAALDKLRDRGGPRLLMLFSRGEAMYSQLERSGQLARLHRWPNVAVEEIPSWDHELRALWLQAHVRDRLDRALDELVSELRLR